MSQREIDLARELQLNVFHEEMTAERVKMIARVKAKREGKRHTLSIKTARAFKYQIQGRA